MKIVMSKSPEIKSHWSKLKKEESDLLEKIERMDAVISSDNVVGIREGSTFDWFSTMNKYISYLSIGVLIVSN